MNMTRFLKAILAVSVVAACACGLAACSGNGNSSSSGGAAATVNGTEIPEEKVTTTIQNFRAQSGFEEQDAWGEYLVSSDMTPQSIREQVINSFVDEELVKEGAAELDIKVESSEIDSYVQSMREKFSDDDAWQKALSQAGFTEEDYRKNIEKNLTQQKINTHFSDEAKVEDSDILESAETYSSYYDGAKRTSHILIKVENVDDKKAMKQAREKAQEIIDRINNGEISFEDAAKEYSEDSSAEKGGDVGWDVLNSFVTEYTDAVDKLDKGQISEPVDSQYGVHIITVTDVFNAPKKVKSIEDFPEEFRTEIENHAKSMKSNDDYTAWLDGLREKADIQINDMPADVPYNIDLTPYQKSDEAAASDESVTVEEASDEAASGEAAEGEAASGEAAEGETASGEAASGEAAPSDETAEGDAAASDEAAEGESSEGSAKAA